MLLIGESSYLEHFFDSFGGVFFSYSDFAIEKSEDCLDFFLRMHVRVKYCKGCEAFGFEGCNKVG